jgi:hypothetical protein
MNKLVIPIAIFCVIFLSSCSKSSSVNTFLVKFENVVKKYEDKEKVDSLKYCIPQITLDNQDLLKMSDNLKEDYPVSKWGKLQVDRFKDLGKRFMFLRLNSGGGVDRTPLPFDGKIGFSKPSK